MSVPVASLPLAQVAASGKVGSSVAFAARTTSGRFEKQRLSLRGARTGKMRTFQTFAASELVSGLVNRSSIWRLSD